MPRATRSQDEQASVMTIGIDFGTTFSGIAFAHSSRPNDIETIVNWVDGHNTDKGKCPTLLTYDDDQVISWAYNAVRDPKAVRWFKLLLLQPEDLPADVRECDEVQRAREKMLALGKQPVELVADFLKQLWTLTHEKMVKSNGLDVVEGSQFHVVLSVPAIWPDYAKDMMREAARWAGICADRPSCPAGQTVLDLISEPEAAALATMMDKFANKFTPDGEAMAQVGDCFVVCDAGGGTVDLITYKIKSVKPWRIEECVRGDGKLCGAVMLDKSFRNILRAKVNPKIWQKASENSNIFEVQWEKIIKREYKVTAGNQYLNLPFRDSRIPPEDWHPVVTLTPDDLKSVFDPVTKSITDLVKKQIAAIPRRTNTKGPPAKYVVLVGGLGSSNHLYQSLKAELSAGGEGPKILQSEGPLPWTAICRGAVLHGFNQQKLHGNAVRGAPSFDVQARIARRSYGTICTFEEWDERFHHIDDRRYCPVEDSYVADYQMSWFVRAGEPIGEGEVKLCAFNQALENPEDLEDGVTTELVYSDNPRPPKRCDGSVKKLCDIRWEQVPAFGALPERVTDAGRDIRDLSYDIEMVFKGASAHFGIWHEEERVASRNVLVDFKDSGNAARKERSKPAAFRP